MGRVVEGIGVIGGSGRKVVMFVEGDSGLGRIGRIRGFGDSGQGEREWIGREGEREGPGEIVVMLCS